MKAVEQILKQAKLEQWPYPKTFSLLKNVGVEEYRIDFINDYSANYHGSFGTWQEPNPLGYKPLELASSFYKEKVQSSIRRHAQGKTTFVEFLSDLAASGVSHYRVNMSQRTVTYFNGTESEGHQEVVPELAIDTTQEKSADF